MDWLGQVLLVAIGGLFLTAAGAIGRGFAASRDRSVAVAARVTGFRVEEKPDPAERRVRTYHYAQFRVVGGSHADAVGESSMGVGSPLYQIGDVVDAFLDPKDGTITGAKGRNTLKVLLVLFILAGAGLMLLGLYVG